MEVVQRFLQLRREGRAEEAYAMLAPGASVGCPWGGMYHGARVREMLLDEPRFAYKDYLCDVPITPIDEHTFQRKYKWNRGMFEMGTSRWRYFGLLSTWRDVYVVRDGAICLVATQKLARNKSFASLLRLDVAA